MSRVARTGHWLCQQAGEGGATRPAARHIGEPLAELDEIQPRCGEDMAEVDLRLPAVARAAQATAADAAGKGALDPGTNSIGLPEVGRRLAPTRGLERLELRPRAQAQGPTGQPALGAAAGGAVCARPAVLARELH